MIIYIDANGEVLEQEYTEVVQGDNDANNIYLIAPLAQNAVVTMSFECPNGYVTDTYLMTPSIDNMVGGLRMWKLSIENIPITQYYGIVKYQFKATINGKTIAVARGKFKVQEGVDWQLPIEPDKNTYIDILNQVEAELINKVNINYNNDDVEQEIINNENGLKLVKTEGETTSVYEFKADGLYQNGVKIVDANELEAVKDEIEAELALLQVDLEAVKEDLANTKTELNNKIDTVEADLTGQIATVNSDLIEFKETAENQFELIDDAKGTKIVASVDNQTYIMNFELQNSKGTTISTSQIDLPLESVVVNGTYADGILTLTLKNGNSVDINITDIISGLATEEYVDGAINELSTIVENKIENNSVVFTINSEDWQDLADKEPYKFSATIDCDYSIKTTGEPVYELINNNPVNFANYGFVLNEVSFGTPEAIYLTPKFTFYAMEKPTESVNLRVLITAKSVELIAQEGGITL